jgi:hypothetical protein
VKRKQVFRFITKGSVKKLPADELLTKMLNPVMIVPTAVAPAKWPTKASLSYQQNCC